MPRPRRTQISLEDTPYYHCCSRVVRRLDFSSPRVSQLMPFLNNYIGCIISFRYFAYV